jgi:tetratricopeptide (TPR) repeat protein
MTVPEAPSWKRWAPPVLVVAAVLLCFLPAFQAGFTNWDDDVNFTKNPNYRGFTPSTLKWMFTDCYGHYMPITWLTLALDYTLWGMNPAGYHATNVLWHGANAVLFYFVLGLLLRRADPAGSEAAHRWAAATGALVFAVHPLRVESVAWVTERRDVVSGLFFLVSVLTYLKSTDAPTDRARVRWLAASLAAFLASILSKAMGMALPLVLVALDVYPLRRFSKRALLEKIPYLLLMLLAVALTALGQGQAKAIHSAAEYSIVDRLLQPSYRVLFYLGKTLFPVPLAPIYLFEPAGRPPEFKYFACLLAAAGITAGLIVYRRRWPAGLTAWVAYGVLLAPVIGVVQAGAHFAADRYTYLACLPWAALAAGLVLRLRAPFGAVGAAAVLLVLGVLTWRQAGTWKDSKTLWNTALETDPKVYLAWVNRGVVRMGEGDAEGAISDYSEGLRLNPNYWAGYSNRAAAYIARKNWNGAIGDCTRALEMRPDYAQAYSNRGVARAGKGDLRGAIDDYTRALAINPDYAEAYGSRGLARRGLGDAAGARTDFEAALRCAPPDWPYRKTLEALLPPKSP